jgi:copper chaperone NosL
MHMKAHNTISGRSALGMGLSAVLIMSVFIFPLWVISLWAPQYPQGLGLLIHVDRIEGMSEHDLQNINGLNHYIGMHRIEPDSIQELRYMKWFALGLAAAAAMVALLRRRSLLLAWVVLAIALSAVGMYDFYQWEYRYGHELDSSAAIKVPGMTYQPPMFGTKQMLNFRATAWPGAAGWMAMLAVGLSVVCVAYEYRFRGKIRPVTARQPARHPTAAAPAGLFLCAIAAGTLLQGCNREPEPIAFGGDACAMCSMTISDRRHGAVFVSDKGRTYKFDAVECMIESQVPGEKFSDVVVSSYHVVDYSHPGTVVKADDAEYLVSPAVPSPMGANVSAFGTQAGADSVRTAKGGEVMTWAGIREYLVRRATS